MDKPDPQAKAAAARKRKAPVQKGPGKKPVNVKATEENPPTNEYKERTPTNASTSQKPEAKSIVVKNTDPVSLMDGSESLVVVSCPHGMFPNGQKVRVKANNGELKTVESYIEALENDDKIQMVSVN